MIKIAVVEDEKIYSDQMVRFIKSYSKETNIEFKVYCYTCGENFLKSCETNKYDLVFMDIILPEYDGLEISRKFRQLDSSAVLIFVTNMAQYAINGYDVDASDFLVKPVSYINFNIKMTKAINLLRKRKGSDVLLKSISGSVIRLSNSDICYVECLAHYINYCIIVDESSDRMEIVTTRDTFSRVEKELVSDMIVKCHRSYLVNLSYIVKVETNSVFVKDVNGTKNIPISRTYKSEFLKKLHEAYKG